jgi:hypothetical protein
MTVGRVKAFNSTAIRLVVQGGWTPDADREISNGGFDRLELVGGEYADFRCLQAHAEKISSLRIDVTCKSAEGLSSLQRLKSLSVGNGISTKFDLGSLKALRQLNFDAWHAKYEQSLAHCDQLESLRIEGYDGTDCSALAGC